MKTKWSEMYIDDIILLLTFYVVFWYNRHSVCFRLCQGRAETHRNRGDMIEVYQILTGKYDPILPGILHRNINSTTRGTHWNCAYIVPSTIYANTTL